MSTLNESVQNARWGGRGKSFDIEMYTLMENLAFQFQNQNDVQFRI